MKANYLRLMLVVGASSLLGAPLLAQTAPMPPCAGTPAPPYAAAGKEPNLRLWSGQEVANWRAPSCVGWSDAQGGALVALAGTVPHVNSLDELLERFGAVSAQRGIRYWSVTDMAWRVLIAEATAQRDDKGRERRGDFSGSEMKSGQDLYFSQNDTRSTGEVVYRMRVRNVNARHATIEIENVSPVRTFFVTLFRPGGMRFLYFLDRNANGAWNLYSLLSVSGSFVEGNEASFTNRAVAFYRHFAGVPTDGVAAAAK